jgi:hypothetical protein
MFEDLVPSPRVEASAPPAGMFDDLIPAGGASGAVGGAFADPVPGMGEDIVRSIPYGVAAGWAGLASDVTKGVAAERIALGLGEPDEVEQAPTAAESLEGIEQVTGPLYRPRTRGGRVSVAAAGAATNPLSYLAPGGLFAKFIGAVTSGLGSELAKEAAEGTGFENVASFGGGLAGGLIPGYATAAMERLRMAPRAPMRAPRAEPPLPSNDTTPALSGTAAKPREGGVSSTLSAPPPQEPTAVDSAAAGHSGGQQTAPRGLPESVPESPSVATRDLPSEQQVADNRAKIIGFLKRVGVPPDRVGPTEIDAVARRMGNLPQPDTVERAALRSALERGVVSPDEVDLIYGAGAADAVRGTPTPANVQVDPAQGRTSGQPTPYGPEGQPVPRAGESGGETGTASPTRSRDERPPIAANRGDESGDVPSRPTDESARPAEPSSTSRRGSAEPAGPAETVRPVGVDRNSARASDPSSHPSVEDGARNTGPPLDQLRPSENGAPSGAVSVSAEHEPPGRTLSAEQTNPATANPIKSEAAPQDTIAAQKLSVRRLWYQPRRRGQAPFGDDGHPIELHHVGQEHGGGLIEMTRTEHRGLGNFKANHHNTGQKASLIDRWRARRERYKYWAEEWDAYTKKERGYHRFDDLIKLSEAEWKQLRPPMGGGGWSSPPPPDSRGRKYLKSNASTE